MWPVIRRKSIACCSNNIVNWLSQSFTHCLNGFTDFKTAKMNYNVRCIKFNNYENYYFSNWIPSDLSNKHDASTMVLGSTAYSGENQVFNVN